MYQESVLESYAGVNVSQCHDEFLAQGQTVTINNDVFLLHFYKKTRNYTFDLFRN